MPALRESNGQLTKVGLWTGTVIKYQGERYKVTKLNRVNVKILGEDGKQYNFNRNAAERLIDSDQSWDGPKEKNPYELDQENRAAGIVLGSVVRLVDKRLTDKYGDDTKWVVIAKPNDGTMKITQLGGWGDAYLRKITAAQVEVVNF